MGEWCVFGMRLMFYGRSLRVPVRIGRGFEDMIGILGRWVIWSLQSVAVSKYVKRRLHEKHPRYPVRCPKWRDICLKPVYMPSLATHNDRDVCHGFRMAKHRTMLLHHIKSAMYIMENKHKHHGTYFIKRT